MRAIGPTGESFALTMDPVCLTGSDTVAGLCLVGRRNGRLVMNITTTAEGERRATGWMVVINIGQRDNTVSSFAESDCESTLKIDNL